MSILKSFGEDLSYEDILELDGSFSICHINYNKTPRFYKTDGINVAINSRKNSLTNNKKIEDVIGNIDSFNGTEKDFKKNDRIALWRVYWLEYINAFNKLNE